MIIGTRESELAMRQTEIFIKSAEEAHGEFRYEIRGMKALGDRDLNSPLNEFGSVGAFVRELDDALLRREIDVSVNSLKDIPTAMRGGLVVGAVLPRDDPVDVILPCPLDELPEGAVVGTSSIRRRRLLLSARPDLIVDDLRGNIHTRLGKLDSGKYDAVILAKAGLDRMRIDRGMFVLDPEVFVPSPAQGTIAVECRADDRNALDFLRTIDDATTRRETDVERGIMRLLGAGCSSPVGINAATEGRGIRIVGVSFANSPEPARVNSVIPIEYADSDLMKIADILRGGGIE